MNTYNRIRGKRGNTGRVLFNLLALLLAAPLSTHALAADTCDAAIAEFNQRTPLAVVDPANPDAGPSDTRAQALLLFAQGHELCSKGLETEGVAAINQALVLLLTQP
jgi:hypothetical protein